MNMADRLSSIVVETTFKDIPADTVIRDRGRFEVNYADYH